MDNGYTDSVTGRCAYIKAQPVSRRALVYTPQLRYLLQDTTLILISINRLLTVPQAHFRKASWLLRARMS